MLQATEKKTENTYLDICNLKVRKWRDKVRTAMV